MRDARRCAPKIAEIIEAWGGPDGGAKVSCAFFDPPYIPGMAYGILASFWAGCEALGPGRVFAADALLILRTHDKTVAVPPGLRLLESRQAGNGRLWLFQQEDSPCP
jgi:hypothetical protein